MIRRAPDGDGDDDGDNDKNDDDADATCDGANDTSLDDIDADDDGGNDDDGDDHYGQNGDGRDYDVYDCGNDDSYYDDDECEDIVTMTIRDGRREGGERNEDAGRCGIPATTQLQTGRLGTHAIHGKANLCKARQPNPFLGDAWQHEEIQRNANQNKCKKLKATQTNATKCNANRSIAKQPNAARLKAKQRKATQYKTMGHTNENKCVARPRNAK